MKKAFVNEYIKELKLPCYDIKTGDEHNYYYYYYDVLEALCRSLFQDLLNEAQQEALEEIRHAQLHGSHSLYEDDESDAMSKQSQPIEPPSSAKRLKDGEEFNNNQTEGEPHDSEEINIEKEHE